MEKNLVMLQQFEIKAAFWYNQTLFAMFGETREEKLGIGFAKRYETISSVDAKQKEWLDYLRDSNEAFDSKLLVILDKLHKEFVQEIMEMDVIAVGDYSDFIHLIEALIKEAQSYCNERSF